MVAAKAGIKGVWRVYYNDTREAPLIWSIDDGDPGHEGKFSKVELYGKAETTFDIGRQPHGWITIAGELVIDGTTAHIWGGMWSRGA
jgi:hypothetical protein